ncbi:hypothetical protein ACEWY4_026640 [Coilia grayii]|uniref:Uncharacterized protein n=1 Tax=Coilia grayii TaxID=363190 RepID=A0ABD1IT67_9TELE
MFKNKTAWFSNSVKRGIPSVWVREGGLLVSWRRASYLFSDDASCPDTHSIFMSRQYAEGKVTVFHSAFISVCNARQSVKSVGIGHYVLPPLPVQQEVKAVIGRFIWEEEDLTEEPEVEEVGLNTPVFFFYLRFFNLHTKGIQFADEVLMSLDELLTASGKEETACCGVQHYPVNNMLSGYVGIEQLTRYTGELQDFLPGQGGYSVSIRNNRRHLTADHPQGRGRK